MRTNLTLREIEIVKLVVADMTTSQIATKLGISISTVESHRRNIYKKLGIQTVVGLIKKVKELKIIQL
jgi:DNA-binding CsgD family transcriptional regulator